MAAPLSSSDQMKQICLALVALLIALPVHAVETIGPIYEILEPDMLEEILRNLQDQERKGILAKKKKDAIERSTRSIEEPPAVEGLRTTTKARSFYWDPTVVANENILDNEGRIVVAAGTKVNPLDYVAMPQHFFFFDGKDASQVSMAQSIDKHYDGRVKLIMTSGRVLDLTRKWKKQIFFDQGGVLIRKFGIQQVPALVYQEGRVLRIDEMEAKL